MSWATDALAALRKIIILEERVATLSGDLKDMAKLSKELERRLVKVETKLEIYEKLSAKNPKGRFLE